MPQMDNMLWFNPSPPCPDNRGFQDRGVRDICFIDKRKLPRSTGCRPSLSDERPFRALFPPELLVELFNGGSESATTPRGNLFYSFTL